MTELHVLTHRIADDEQHVGPSLVEDLAEEDIVARLCNAAAARAWQQA